LFVFNSSTQYFKNAASAGIFERDLVETCGSKFGFRALAVSEDGKYLAAGDCGGNLHIYDLQESEYTCFMVILATSVLNWLYVFTGWCPDIQFISLLLITILQDAHEAEIQSLSFSFPVLTNVDSENASSLLASGGKGRAIHIYDVKRCKNKTSVMVF